MTNKIFNKTVNKKVSVLTLAVAVVLLAAAIIVSVLCGVNYGAGIEDSKTVTVTVNSFVYNNEREALEEVCENVFEEQGISAKYVYRAEMSGDNRELAFVFDADTDDAKLAAAKTALKTKLDAEAADEESAISGAIVDVTTSSEAVQNAIASSRLWRSAIAVGVFAVLAFIYVAIRYRLSMGFVALSAPIVAAALTTSIVLLTRIPVTNATFYAVLIAAIVAVAFTVMLMNKIRENAKTEAFENADAETLVKGSLATKWIGWTAIVLGAAIVLVGAVATAAVRYFAIASLVGVIVAAFVGLIFAPASACAAKAYVDKKAANKTASGYVGAKKEKSDEE
ncbi:MAG: hypothetical protein IJ329_04930 [Clostridia bacterium]|nr:hypothetical protein [Clostridia bacterium]